MRKWRRRYFRLTLGAGADGGAPVLRWFRSDSAADSVRAPKGEVTITSSGGATAASHRKRKHCFEVLSAGAYRTNDIFS